MDNHLSESRDYEAPEDTYEPRLEPEDPQPLQEQYVQETRLNVRLSPKVANALSWIATILDVSRVDAVRHAIGTAKFFLEVREKGGTVFVKMPNDKHYQRVVFAE